MTAPLPASFRADVRLRADDLRARRVPFVVATVVRAERPTSAKPGDAALVLGDGTIVGFVGGECAEASVQLHALNVLRTGEPVLLRITPDGPDDSTTGAGRSPGVTTVHNPCLSGGTLEIFLAPENPPPLVLVHGDGPIARAVVRMAEALGYATSGTDGFPEGAVAVVVASHGRGEAVVLREALTSGVGYIGLVASRRRGDSVLTALDLAEDEKVRVRTPAGLDIGARTPEEVALSILAEIVATRPRLLSAPSPPETEEAGAGAVSSAVDPVCGMTVAAVDATLQFEVDGRRFFFCGSGCRNAFAADPGMFVGR